MFNLGGFPGCLTVRRRELALTGLLVSRNLSSRHRHGPIQTSNSTQYVTYRNLRAMAAGHGRSHVDPLMGVSLRPESCSVLCLLANSEPRRKPALATALSAAPALSCKDAQEGERNPIASGVEGRTGTHNTSHIACGLALSGMRRGPPFSVPCLSPFSGRAGRLMCWIQVAVTNAVTKRTCGEGKTTEEINWIGELAS